MNWHVQSCIGMCSHRSRGSLKGIYLPHSVINSFCCKKFFIMRDMHFIYSTNISRTYSYAFPSTKYHTT